MQLHCLEVLLFFFSFRISIYIALIYFRISFTHYFLKNNARIIIPFVIVNSPFVCYWKSSLKNEESFLLEK